MFDSEKHFSWLTIIFTLVFYFLKRKAIVTHDVYVQGDSGGICITLGYDSMSDSKQKVHTNRGPILNGYGVITAWNLE